MSETVLSGDAIPNNLPAQTTTFIGRTDEKAEVRRLLNETRMLTFTGAGGCGKTRLALEVAADVLPDYPDGVWWVDLAPVADAFLVPGALASVVSIKESQSEAFAETLVRKIRRSRMLLVIDNCEHLVSACAELAKSVLSGCSEITILATSREPLAVQGETAFRVPSLTFPEPMSGGADISEYESVRLFCDRAARARRNFRLNDANAPDVAEICRRVEGIPLAIELAAGRVRSLSPARITKALTDSFRLLTGGARTALPRQRTLEASIDWSYGLLEPQARVLLARLSVFAGSFDLDAAEAVCAGEVIDRDDVLDVLSSLVDRSLVQMETDERYRMLETIRIYARQRLVDSGEAAVVRTRHLEYYVELARASRGGHLGRVLAYLGSELDNLRGAMDWALSSGQAGMALQLAGFAWPIWHVRGSWTELRRRLDAALEDETDDRDSRARALEGARAISFFMGDFRAARNFADEVVDLARSTRQERRTARSIAWLGFMEMFMEAGAARRHDDLLTEAVALARGIGDLGTASFALASLANLRMAIDTTGARALAEKAVALGRQADDPIVIGFPLNVLGSFHVFGGSFDEARRRFDEQLEAARRVGDEAYTSSALFWLASVAIYEGNYDRSRELLDESREAAAGARHLEALARAFSGLLSYVQGGLVEADRLSTQADHELAAVGAELQRTITLRILALTSLRRAESSRARDLIGEALALCSGPSLAEKGSLLNALARIARAEGDDNEAEGRGHEALRFVAARRWRPWVADSLEILAGLAAIQESASEAARLFGAAQSLRNEIGYVRFPVDQASYMADVGLARDGPCAEDFADAWAEGESMSMDEAVAYAERGRGDRKRPSAGWASLTPTELDVVRLTAQGLTNPQIAERLFVSRNTVKVHISHVFSKLGVSTRTELAAHATRRGV